MTTQDPFAFLKNQTASNLMLAEKLARMNIDSLENSASTRFSLFKGLVAHLSSLSSADPNTSSACGEVYWRASIEYWKDCTLDGLAYQHQVLQILAKHACCEMRFR